MNYDAKLFSGETARIKSEYVRREKEIDADLYAPWQPAENFIVWERKATAADLLHKAGKFPKRGEKVLEIGYGKLGWLADLISWGVTESDLHGIELDEKRAAEARAALPNADLRTGDAANLPWENETFNSVVISTVFSSILNSELKKLIASEIERVLISGGVVIWYDLAVNNPKNANVKAVKADELKRLFPNFTRTTKRITLAPPIARFTAPKSGLLTAFFNSFKILRTHFLAVLIKK